MGCGRSCASQAVRWTASGPARRNTSRYLGGSDSARSPAPSRCASGSRAKRVARPPTSNLDHIQRSGVSSPSCNVVDTASRPEADDSQRSGWCWVEMSQGRRCESESGRISDSACREADSVGKIGDFRLNPVARRSTMATCGLKNENSSRKLEAWPPSAKRRRLRRLRRS